MFEGFEGYNGFIGVVVFDMEPSSAVFKLYRPGKNLADSPKSLSITYSSTGRVCVP